MADEFDGNHQRREGWHGPGEVLQVANTSVFESLSLVVHKGADRAAQGNDGHGGWRLEARNHADQIAEQNEKEERGQKWCVTLTVVADDLVALALDESFDALESVLKSSGTIHGEPRTDQKEHNEKERKDENFHRERVRNRSRWMFGRKVHGLQQRRDGAGEQTIQ